MSQLPSEVGFVLFKPDLFCRRLLAPMLQFLKDCGFTPLSFLAARVTDAQYRKMYSSQFLWNVDDWYHNKQLYTFGPGLGVLLRHGKKDAQELLSQIKGSALPKQRKEGSLRKTFLSKSRVFNLIHVPDNTLQAEEEALQWFGGSLSFDCVNSKEMLTELECFNDSEGQLRLDPEEAFLNAKLRLFHTCRNSRGCPQQLKGPLSEVSLFYHRWKTSLLSKTECEGVEGTLLPDFQREEGILCQQLLNAYEIDPSRRQAIAVLSAAATTKYISTFFWILDEWNVYLSELEKYMILCRLKYNSSSPKDQSSHQSKIEQECSFR